MRYSTMICFGLAAISLQGCSTLEQEKSISNIPDKFIDPANMDTTVRPGNDFFEYANGTWLKNNPIPAKETRWGSFNELREFNAHAVKSLLEIGRASCRERV